MWWGTVSKPFAQILISRAGRYGSRRQRFSRADPDETYEAHTQPSQRENAIGEVYRRWKRSDAQAAEAWLRSVPGISDQMRENMIEWK
jgi:hypothetical protein